MRSVRSFVGRAGGRISPVVWGLSIAALLLTGACSNNGQVSTAEVGTAAVVSPEVGTAVPLAAAEPVSIGLVNASPMDYYGRSVTFTGRVNYTRQPGIFVVTDMRRSTIPQNSPRPESGDDEILVVSHASALDRSIRIGDTVRLTGEVRSFDADMASALAPTFGGAGYNVGGGLYDRWRGRPAIQASVVERLSYPAVVPGP